MKITLLSPKGPLYRHRGGIFGRRLRYAPLTLTTLASLIPEELGAKVEIWDEGIAEFPDPIAAEIVGITVITGTAPRAYEIADSLRAAGTPVVLGGPHVTLVPEEAARHADSIVTGYAEQTWPALLRDFAAGRMAPRYVQNADFSFEGLPYPRRDLFDPRQFLTTAVFEATRSCAHDCEFCVAPTAWGRRPYLKPVDYVIEDIRRHGARRILFVDLNLISDRAHARKLFEAMVPLGVRWFGLSTTLIAHDPPLLELMARSGCSGLLLGFESMLPGTLRETRKGFNDPSTYSRLVRDLHDHGISVMGCFVFGLDHDTPAVFRETVGFCAEAGIDLPRFAVATPFPGTPFFRRLEAEGRILTRNWELYDAQHVVFRPARMSVEELQRGHESAWRSAYSWRTIARRLTRSRTNIATAIPANLGYRFYAHRLHSFYNCDWYIGQSVAVRRSAA
jgi:radical SAM superfamily enzyme YgiQ (UPF0313 family)